MKILEWACLAAGVSACLRCSTVLDVGQYEFSVAPLEPDASAEMNDMPTPTDESTLAQWDSSRTRWDTATWN